MGAAVQIQLHPKQMEVYSSGHRFKVVVAGRRGGKTVTCRSSIIKYARKRNQKIWYVAPTFPMARQIMWDELLEAIPRRWVKKVNHSIMSIRLINGTIIELKGADRYDTLRGVGLNFVVLDEAQDMKPDVWKKAIRPTLSSTGGHALITGTPKGFNLLYELYKLGQRKDYEASGIWKSWQFATSESPFVPLEEIEQARRDLDPKSFRQEYEASFETMSGRVYYPFQRATHTGEYPFNPKLPIWVGQDFNIDPMSSVIMQPQANGDVWVVDEIIMNGSSTAEVCEAIDRKYFRYQRQIVIYPDASSGHRQHARGESDLDIFRERGFERIRVKKANPPISDRVNAVNSMLLTGDGRMRLKVNGSCRETIRALEQTIYKPGGRDIDKAAGVEHPADAIGYCIDYEFPLRRIAVGGYSH